MDLIFKSLPDLIKKFPDHETARMFLEQHRWNGTPICPYCKGNRTYVIEGGKRYKCAAKECNKKFSVTVGTVFEDSKIPLNTWFAAIYLMSSHKKGVSSLQLARDLAVSNKTAWHMLHRIREIFRLKSMFVIDDIAMADESFIGGKNKNRHADKKVPNSQGRSFKDKTPVLGVMHPSGIISTEVIPNTQAATLKPLIEKMVKEGAILITDDWGPYNSLNSKYSHVVVDHQNGEYARGAFSTNQVENFWSHLKRGIYGIYHQVSSEHLSRYCDEFEYRYNSRKVKDNERFILTLQRTEGCLRYKDLVKKATTNVKEKEVHED